MESLIHKRNTCTCHRQEKQERPAGIKGLAYRRENEDNTVCIGAYEDNIYYDLVQTNTSDDTFIRASFSNVRANAVLAKANEYEMAVVRFTLPSSALPIFVFEPTKYVVSLVYDDGKARTAVNQTVAYVADNDLVTTDPQYYYVYSYQHMLDMINTAYADAMTALIVLVPALAGTSPPYVVYEATSDLLTLVAPDNIYNSNASPLVEVWYNNSLSPFLTGFHIYHSSALSTNLNYKFMITSNGNNYYANPPAPPAPYPAKPTFFLQQEFDTLSLWNSPRAVIFTSGKVPVRPELTPVPQVNQDAGLSSAGDASLSIIADFALATENGHDIRTVLTYTPSVFRWIDLISDNPMREIDFQVLWQDREQNTYGFYIPPGDTITLKLAFRRKARPVINFG